MPGEGAYAPALMDARPDRTPLLAGIAAARANLIPGALIQAVMLTLVLAYYFYPPARHALDVLAGWKRQYGYAATFLLLGLTGGLLPEALRIGIFQRGAVHAANFRDMAFGFLFWGFMGCCTDTFYRFQALLFGNQVTAAVLTKKVMLDMCVYTPLWGSPAPVCAYEWKQSGFSADVGRFFSLKFYRSTILPTLIANWGVWIPMVAIIYSLPLLLQVPLFALASSFWALLVASMTRGRPRPALQPC